MSAKGPNNPNDHVIIKTNPIRPGENLGIRREISKWTTKTPQENIQLSLFIRALQRFYDKPHTEKLSYFQIAGIHGYPGDLPWDNSEMPHRDKRYPKKMYCTHNELTFPTWHRPYMALFEQTVSQLMTEVIDDLKITDTKEKEKWAAESADWRMPYWNWALTPTEIPELLQNAEVTICSPSGRPKETVKNPLYRYELQVDGKVTLMGDPILEEYRIEDVEQKNGVTLPWSKCSGTSRWGITSSNPAKEQSEGINNYQRIVSAIRAHEYYPGGEITRHPVSDLVGRLLCHVKDWPSFASTVTANKIGKPEWTQWISLEFIHNNLHLFIGGADGFEKGIGHMSNVPVAAFDPIFWMHHCYVDCLLAIWRELYPNEWFSPKEDGQRPLPPFHGDFGSRHDGRGVAYFNSDDVKDHRAFGYQYDAIIYEANETAGSMARMNRLKEHINNLYRGTGDVLQADRGGLFKGKPKGDKDVYEDYVINVLYDRYGYKNGVPYTIHFFFKNSPTEAEVRDSARSIHEFPGHVGSVFTFSSLINGGTVEEGSSPHCAKCAKQRDEGVLSRASVPLTIPLYKDAVNKNVKGIMDLDPVTVETYLKGGLTWVAVSMEGRFIPWSELKKTKIFVLQGIGEHPTEDTILSIYRDYVSMPEATDGKEAGATAQDYTDFESGGLSALA